MDGRLVSLRGRQSWRLLGPGKVEVVSGGSRGLLRGVRRCWGAFGTAVVVGVGIGIGTEVAVVGFGVGIAVGTAVGFVVIAFVAEVESLSLCYRSTGLCYYFSMEVELWICYYSEVMSPTIFIDRGYLCDFNLDLLLWDCPFSYPALMSLKIEEDFGCLLLE